MSKFAKLFRASADPPDAEPPPLPNPIQQPPPPLPPVRKAKDPVPPNPKGIPPKKVSAQAYKVTKKIGGEADRDPVESLVTSLHRTAYPEDQVWDGDMDERVTTSVRRVTYQLVKIKLLQEGSDLEFAELIEYLLRAWLTQP
ncbi:MAG: hypothetical protein NW237_01350 [Cyanobacteriota bacterium]|nr:hypothetical protein [Cyanobacteriota bacterium]